ncbi:MAG: proteasome subunit alpha [Bifidobacteriaceae bacterium]|jgi:proteasome alpha subunit|nr:proteasome subunit alpha [Bifidobacteriaceae bacterium]
MTVPYYVPPEQLIKDRADFARRGVARGRPAVVISAADGILLATHNPSRALVKISEVYDRIAFAGVGKYNEFEALRVAGIRYADLRGYAYDRSDVTARGLAGAYAQTIAAAFTAEPKPMEVEVAVAEVGHAQAADAVFLVSYDGSVNDEHPWALLGGVQAQARLDLAAGWRPGLPLAQAAALAQAALGPEVPAAEVEAALLRRGVAGRAFSRLTTPLARLAEAPKKPAR